MSSLNKVCLLGRLGRDPEVRTTQNGKEIANFSIATSEKWTAQDGQKTEKTEWHRIVCFNDGLTRVIKEYVKKGSQVYIEGQLQTRKWQDQQGQDKYSTEIVMKNFAATLILLGGKEKYAVSGYGQDIDQDKQIGGMSDEAMGDEIPF